MFPDPEDTEQIIGDQSAQEAQCGCSQVMGAAFDEEYKESKIDQERKTACSRVFHELPAEAFGFMEQLRGHGPKCSVCPGKKSAKSLENNVFSIFQTNSQG